MAVGPEKPQFQIINFQIIKFSVTVGCIMFYGLGKFNCWAAGFHPHLSNIRLWKDKFSRRPCQKISRTLSLFFVFLKWRYWETCQKFMIEPFEKAVKKPLTALQNIPSLMLEKVLNMSLKSFKKKYPFWRISDAALIFSIRPWWYSSSFVHF